MSSRTKISLFQKTIFSWVTETNLLRSKSEPCETLADVCEFFDVFKHKINFSGLEDFTLINFLCDHFPDFVFQIENDKISPLEHIYVYSLLLFFSCVDRNDPFFQRASTSVGHLHQRVIYKFLSVLTERQVFDKESLGVAINAACTPGSVPPLKIPYNFQTGASPPTPKSIMLNSKTLKIRNLEAELMTERHRIHEVEIDYQERLNEMKKQKEEMKTVISNLQREILEKESKLASMSCDLEIDKACKILLKEISDKTELILDFEQTIQILNTENDQLSEKLCNSEIRARDQLFKISELEDTIHSLEDEIERQSMRNSELTSHVEGLNSFIANSRRLDESLDAVDFFHNETNNNSISIIDQQSPVLRPRAFSIESHTQFFRKNRKFYRSTTYKESERYLSVADELTASQNNKNEEGEANETQLSIFFDSLHEGRRESVPIVKFKELEGVNEEEGDDISPACNKLLMELKKENEDLRKVNESLALAQLASKRPKRGFKFCVIS